MLLTKTSKVKWTRRNQEHFIDLNYKFTKFGDEFDAFIDDLTTGAHNKIRRLCDNCGDLIEAPYYLYIRRRYKDQDLCQKCSEIRSLNDRKEDRAVKMLSRARMMCDQKGYTMKTTVDEYTGAEMNIVYVCPKHGEITGRLMNIITGHGCPYCANDRTGDRCRISQDDIRREIESHNGNLWLNYGEYKHNKLCNLHIRCGCGQEFVTNYVNYKYRDVRRCPKCSQTESKGEREIREFLKSLHIAFIQEYTFEDCVDKEPLPFDFYLPQYNLIIEFDGMQHYKPVFGQDIFEYTKRHDAMKTKYCIDHHIELLRIPYFEFQHLEDIIKNKLDEIG